MQNANSYELIQYLIVSDGYEDDPDRLPSLNELSAELGISVARLREQLEVAKAMGLVDVRPRTGIRKLEYSFGPAVQQSLAYAIQSDRAYFDMFSDLRNHLEAAYWLEAVQKLTAEDCRELQTLMIQAWDKLRGQRIKIPHSEHRCLHMGVFKRLENPFVTGILEAYWDAYEAVGLNVYADYQYLQQVWQYHQDMVDAIAEGDYQRGYEALVEHKDLLYHRSVSPISNDRNLHSAQTE